MKTSLKTKIIASILAFILAASPVCAGELTDAAVQSYEERIAEIQTKKDEALDRLDAIRADSSDALAEMLQYDEIIRYNRDLKNLAEAQLDTIDKQIADSLKNIADTEAKIAQQEKAFENRMVANYMEDDVDYIELILGSTDLVDFLTKIERITAVLKNDKQIIADLNDSRAMLEAEQQRLSEALETQKKRVAEFEQIIADSQAMSDAKEEYMRQLEANEAAWVAVYSANAEAERQLNAELEAYLAEQQAKTQAVYVGDYSDGSTLGWPIEAGAYYYISSEQGWRKLDGVDDNHLGMDIACAAGTDILAANSGTVLKSEVHWSYGEYVLIDHGGGISTLYAHMSERLVQVGDTVTAGQLIGHCGLTGNTKGYHLHFEVRENGKVQNPRNYVTLP